MRITELVIPKGRWHLLLSVQDKTEAAPVLIDLVQQAYSGSKLGSFIKDQSDVIPSDWQVIDWDQDPDIDACIFWRGPRSGESWTGRKIQGLGHDGRPDSRRRAVDQMLVLLGRPGTWIESSDALRHVLDKNRARTEQDADLLRKLFPGSDLRMKDATTYTRKLSDGSKVTETVFGYPVIKNK